LEWNISWFHKTQPLAGLRRDVSRVAQLALLLLEVGDLTT